jgi:hypothetical protein
MALALFLVTGTPGDVIAFSPVSFSRSPNYVTTCIPLLTV